MWGDPEHLVHPEAQGPVHHRHGDGPPGLGDQLMLEAGLGRVADRSRHGPVSLDRRVVSGRGVPACHQELGPLVDHREPGIAVVGEHVRGQRVPGVLDLVVDGEAGLADARLDAPAQRQVLAEHRGLEHLALRPQQALVAVPPLAVADQPGGQAADAPLQPVRDVRDGRLNVQLVEVLGGVLLRHQRVVKPAGHDHAAAPRPEPAPAIRLVVPGTDHPGGGQPARRLAGQLARADVEAAVDQHVEREPGAGPELENANAPELPCFAMPDLLAP